MNVLFVASECTPFVKTGGLADVVAALPKALAAEGIHTRILLPGYPALAHALSHGVASAAVTDAVHGPYRLVAATAEGLDLLILDAPRLYDRPGNPYLAVSGVDWPDNAQRFAALSAAASRIAADGIDGWVPDLVHAHDWQAGLAPAYLRLQGNDRTATVTTIHNIAFQGVFPAELVPQLGLPWSAFNPDGFEYYGSVSFLKAGLVFADKVTTVSPTYARELLSPEFGMGLEGVLAARRDDLVGVLNGVDVETWNPASDLSLGSTYTAAALGSRRANKAELKRRVGLTEEDEAGPLFCVVSRLTRQKGLDLLLEVLPRLLARGASLAVLGSGDSDLEAGFLAAAEAHPGRVGCVIGYDEPLSHLMQGGADSIVIPSRFEPCGLTQLYGLRYGCVPLVARTGGLADTVIDANEAALAAQVATGIQFAPITATALADAIDRTCDLFAMPDTWQAMMVRAMRHPVGWDTSARAYRAVYDTAVRNLN